jgi:hypothetical protein
MTHKGINPEAGEEHTVEIKRPQLETLDKLVHFRKLEDGPRAL